MAKKNKAILNYNKLLLQKKVLSFKTKRINGNGGLRVEAIMKFN